MLEKDIFIEMTYIILDSFMSLISINHWKSNMVWLNKNMIEELNDS